MKTANKSNRSLRRIAPFFLVLFYLSASDGDTVDIGSGHPGLRVLARPYNPEAFFIYQQTTEQPFPGGAGVGYLTNDIIRVVVDHGFRFQRGVRYDDSLQLYPFGPNSAFTQEGGVRATWQGPSYLWPSGMVYTLLNGNVKVLTNAQQAAQAKYHLSSDDGFLGFLDNRVFFCKIGTRPAKIFWREEGSQREYYYRMPRWVLSAYGVTKGTKKDVGISVFRHVWRWPPDSFVLDPYEDGVVEISLSKGKLVKE